MLRRKREIETEQSLPTHCLNCNTEITGAYCSACGQENEPARIPVTSLIKDLWGEVMQVDSKFVRTIWALLVKPGLLTAEYIKGKRIPYLSPFRMYFIVSALFFFLFARIFTLPEKVQDSIVRVAQTGQIPSDLFNGTGKNPFTGWNTDVLGVKINVQTLPKTIDEYEKEQKPESKIEQKPESKIEQKPEIKIETKKEQPKISTQPVDSEWEQLVKKRLIEIRPLLEKSENRPIDFFGTTINLGQLPQGEDDYIKAQKKRAPSAQDTPYVYALKRQLILFRAKDRDNHQKKNLLEVSVLGVSLNLATLPDRIIDYNQEQAKRSPEKRAGFWRQYVTKSVIQVRRSPLDTVKSLLYGTLPLVLLLTVPLFALLLKLFYIKQGYYYVEHLVFALHNHTLMFIVLGIDMFIENRLPDSFFTNAISICTLPGLCLYWFLAMKRVYGQSEPTVATVVKGFFINQGYGCLLFFTCVFGLLLNLLWTLLSL
jgi:Protein of unknown function (DUF3667)